MVLRYTDHQPILVLGTFLVLCLYSRFPVEPGHKVNSKKKKERERIIALFVIETVLGTETEQYSCNFVQGHTGGGIILISLQTLCSSILICLYNN